jgi:hypothetical protein
MTTQVYAGDAPRRLEKREDAVPPEVVRTPPVHQQQVAVPVAGDLVADLGALDLHRLGRPPDRIRGPFSGHVRRDDPCGHDSPSVLGDGPVASAGTRRRGLSKAERYGAP